MNTDEAPVVEAKAEPDWWHRDHPTFTALCGFFTGLVYVIVVPGAFVTLLRLFVDDDTAESLFPFVLLTFAVPIGLLVSLKTRRFGKYMLFGMVTTALVVIGVGVLTAWILIQVDG